MRISIVNSQKKVKFNIEEYRKTALAALAYLDEKTCSLSVYVVDDSEIRTLNYKYRHLDSPTDVLAFSMKDGEQLQGAEGILGDIVISAETALSQARRFRKNIKEEMNLYLVHGILHLVGFDDTRAGDRKKMEQAQRHILTLLERE